METYEFPTLDAFENVHTQTKIQKYHPKLINNVVEGNHCYEISSEINYASAINKVWCRLKHELNLGNKPDSEISVDSNRLPDMYRQLSKYGQNTQGILMKGDLENLTNNFGIMQPEKSRQFVLSSNVEMMRHKGTNASTDGRFGLNDMNFIKSTEESAETGSSCTQRCDPFDSCPVDAAQAMAAASFSHFKERNTSEVFKEFESNSIIKRHSVQRKRHLKNDITAFKGKKQHKCDFCQKSFRHKWNLQKHVLIHTGEKPFQCGVCGKSFKFKQYLQSHDRTHTGEKPHECIVCEKKFSDKSNLNRHKKTREVKLKDD